MVVTNWPISPERLIQQYEAGERGLHGADLGRAELEGADLTGAPMLDNSGHVRTSGLYSRAL